MSEHRPTLSRRRLLAAGAAGVGAAGLGTGVAITATNDRADESPATADFVRFEGVHQSGIATPRPEHGVVAAFDVTAPDRASLAELLRALTVTVREVMAGRVRESNDPLVPPDDNLVLGPTIEPDALTITIAVGASLFDRRYGLAARRPHALTEMPAFPNDELQHDASHGDLVVQICANREDTCAHALRRVMRTGTRYLSLRWVVSGFGRANDAPAGRASTRNLLGFRDGTANLDASRPSVMDDFVWVHDGDEPAWASGGCYMAVRVIRTNVEFWDRTALRTQELVIGRSKASGAPLDGTAETDTPRYSADPEGRVTPVNAHIRLANPRTAESASSAILRRSFNFSRGLTESGHLDQGLLFVCFQRDLSKGFMAVQQRLDGEALEEYVTPIGGGFFFVLPGVTRADGWLGESLLA